MPTSLRNSDSTYELLYLEQTNMDTIQEDSPRSCRKTLIQTIRPYLTRRFFGLMLWGQFLSLMLCATGVSGQKLVISCGVKIPAFQAFCNYVLLSLVFTSQVFYKWNETKEMVKARWWKYIIIAAVDVYANYLVYTAYQYTSLTSVQLLDCLSIPAVVFLSMVLLQAKYKPIHFLGVFICLSGIGFMVWADLTSSRQGPKPGDRHSEMLGDLLVIAGACCYAVSNVAEEYVVKTSTVTEFLGMMSFFASIISGVNVLVFERDHLSNADWNAETVLYLILGAIAMFLFYVLMPILIAFTSATMVNLMLLTADLYSLFAGLYLFNYKFSGLYIFSFVVIIFGVILFQVFPTPSRVDTTNAVGESTTVDSASCVGDDEDHVGILKYDS